MLKGLKVLGIPADFPVSILDYTMQRKSKTNSDNIKTSS